jgi:ketosteroid isomerase-like protein
MSTLLDAGDVGPKAATSSLGSASISGAAPMPQVEDPVLRAMFDRYASAVRGRDLNAFLALYSNDVVIFDAWDRWAHRGKPEWAEAVAIWFASSAAEVLEVDFRETTCAISAGGASAHGVVIFRAVDRSGGTIRAMKNRFTWLLCRESDDWAIVHEHTSVPVRFESKLALGEGVAVQ